MSAQSAQLLNSLSREVDGELFCDPYHRALYSTDASIYAIEPLGVLVPKARSDVIAAVEWAARHGVPLVPRGSGTSLSGQSIGAGLVVDFSKYLNRLVDFDPASRTARVEPGLVLDHFNAALRPHGLQFGPDVATSSRANLGGMIGNNSAGSRSILYGKTVDHVIRLEAVLAGGRAVGFGPLAADQIELKTRQADREGEIYRTLGAVVAAEADEILARYPPLVRRVSGYNLDELVPRFSARLVRPPVAAAVRAREAERFPGVQWNLARLLTGAEGTLGLVTEAEVHLVPLPACRGIAVLEFASLTAAMAGLEAMLACQPSAVELFDKMILELAAESLEYRHYLDFVVGRPESLILVEFQGADEAEVESRLAALADALRGAEGLLHHTATRDPRIAEHIWACRKAALPLLMGVPGQRKPIAFVEDTAVAPARLPEFVARFREILARSGTHGAFYGHASVGVLHIRPLIDTRSRDDLLRFREILDRVADLVLEFEGAMSGEHGDGLARSFLNQKLFGPRVYRAFCQVKRAFDPQGIFNPGKIVDGPAPTDNLRHPPQEQTLKIDTVFDFSRQGGLAGAAALCNGAGVCRKTQTGTMCPSFMATGDEEHSTRGRANALRLVLTGALPAEELTGDKLWGTFELCLQCKGCKAECPSNVDVAKLKAEFLQLYYRRHGVPRAARLMGHVARLNRWGSRLAPLSNLAARLPGAAWLAQRALGIDPRRPLPTFARESFALWFARQTAPPRAWRGPVVLLDDCLTSFCEPRVNQAAVTVLRQAGYEVHLAGLECCGRALLSKGLLDEARQLAERNLGRLAPWLERGAWIVGSEPSCLLTLVDDYPDLVPGPLARQIAARARLVENHLIGEGVELPLRERKARLLLHGHCHQRALVGLADTVKFLEQVPGLDVEVVDSGCCGMAGSFGYEHYELSMRIGGRVLFPAVAADPQRLVAAGGFSCRHQIEHGTGRRALHPIELAAAQLKAQ